VVAEPAEKEITKNDKEVTFHVKVAANSPAGQHKSVFGQIVVTENGEPMAHSVGAGGIMRIDAPAGAKKAAPTGKAPEASPAETANVKAKEGTK